MFSSFNEFVNESTEINFSVDKFISDIKSEMNWNGPDIRQISEKSAVEIYGEKGIKTRMKGCNAFFRYEGRPGSSVRKDILKSCLDKGYKTAKVGVIFNSLRDMNHEYLIGLSITNVDKITNKIRL